MATSTSSLGELTRLHPENVKEIAALYQLEPVPGTSLSTIQEEGEENEAVELTDTQATSGSPATINETTPNIIITDDDGNIVESEKSIVGVQVLEDHFKHSLRLSGSDMQTAPTDSFLGVSGTVRSRGASSIGSEASKKYVMECVTALVSALYYKDRISLSDCIDAFQEGSFLDFMSPFRDVLCNLFYPSRPYSKLMEICENLNRFIGFIKLVYNPKSEPAESYYPQLSRHEFFLRGSLLEMMRDQKFPKRGIVVFLVAANLYFHLLQEMVLIDPAQTKYEDSALFRRIKFLSGKCAEHAMTLFANLWRIRLDRCSPVSVHEMNVNPYPEAKSRSKSQTFTSVIAKWMDSQSAWPDQKAFCYSETAPSGDKYKLAAAAEKVWKKCSECRNKRIEKRFQELDELLYGPLQHTKVWLKLTVQPFMISRDQRLISRTCLATSPYTNQFQYMIPEWFHSLTDFEAQPRVTLEPMADYYSSLYMSLEHSLPRNKFGYLLCALAKHDVRDRCTVLLEMACVPRSHVSSFDLKEQPFDMKYLSVCDQSLEVCRTSPISSMGSPRTGYLTEKTQPTDEREDPISPRALFSDSMSPEKPVKQKRKAE